MSDLDGLIRRGRDKVISLEALADTVSTERAQGRLVALCHGCFDILHFGHLRHFEAAAARADLLVVTVTPDRFVAKGPGRPVFTELERAEMVGGVSAVSWVAINRWPSAVETIGLVRPNLFVKGQDYESAREHANPNIRAELEACERVDCEVIFTKEASSSSTMALERLRAAGVELA